MNDLASRLKYLRKDILHLTQAKFAQNLNLKANSIAQLEIGRYGFTDRTISDICRAYNVNEQWFRYGTGDIFIEQSAEMLEKLFNEYDLSPISRTIIQNYITLPKELQDNAIINYKDSINFSTPNERLKYLRKDILHLTQANMANSLSIDGSTFAKYEKGSIQLIDRSIIDICREFNVNEEWLRNGTGDIFIEQSTELIDQLCKQYNLNGLARQFLETFVTLSDDEATLVYTFVDAFITNNPLQQKNT